MGRKYAFPGQNLTPNVTLVNSLFGGAPTTAIRPVCYEMVIGSRASADNAVAYSLARCATQTGAAAAIVGVPVDPADPAALMTAGTGSATAYTTLTAGAKLLSFGMNQRATFRWIAQPGAEFMFAAAIGTGPVLITETIPTAFAADYTFYFEE